MLRGRTPVLPGKAVASSMIAPALFAWWLWPVSRAVRVGLHSAVVWKRLYLRPLAASFSSVGMRIGPPKALLWPKPMSSISTITTLGAPCGRLHLEARRRLRVARVELGDRLALAAPGSAGPCGRAPRLAGGGRRRGGGQQRREPKSQCVRGHASLHRSPPSRMGTLSIELAAPRPRGGDGTKPTAAKAVTSGTGAGPGPQLPLGRVVRSHQL